MDFTALNAAIRLPDAAAMRASAARWNEIAKPIGSLGAFEQTITRLAGMTGSADVRIDRRAVIVLCADNGVLAQGVAQTPGEITAVMARFIAEKRSSVCIMARQANAEVIAADFGMFTRVDHAALLDRRVGNGTQNMTKGAAMTREQACKAIASGMALVEEARRQGVQILATGEMGIGNTTTSSAVSSVLLGQDPEKMTGRGVGLTDEGLSRKVAAIRRAIEVNRPDGDDAFDVLHKLGGFDIAGLSGVFLGGAISGVPVIIDGFISATAALVAKRLCPRAGAYMLASHLSAEPAARLVMDALDLEPVLHANMRLGEGTGAVALLPLLDMALAVYRELMTYADIGMG